MVKVEDLYNKYKPVEVKIILTLDRLPDYCDWSKEYDLEDYLYDEVISYKYNKNKNLLVIYI